MFDRLPNALWRTLLAFSPRLARADDAFAARLLSAPEYRLYLEMDVRDRAHACAVTKRLAARAPAASPELLRAALLHDVGKSGRPYSALGRIAAALYSPPVRAAPPLRGLPGAWQLKRHHPRYGAARIRRAGGGARVAQIVARHHAPGGDPEAALLREVDGRF